MTASVFRTSFLFFFVRAGISGGGKKNSLFCLFEWTDWENMRSQKKSFLTRREEERRREESGIDYFIPPTMTKLGTSVFNHPWIPPFFTSVGPALLDVAMMVLLSLFKLHSVELTSLFVRDGFSSSCSKWHRPPRKKMVLSIFG